MPGLSFLKMKPAIISPILFLAIFIFINPAQAQRRKVQNNSKYDLRTLHFGFTLAINSTDFRIKHIGDFAQLDSLYVLESIPAKGFNLGPLADLRLGQYFNLRFLPALSFAQRDLYYTFKSGSVSKRTVESTFIDFPLDLKYKSARINNYRMYVLGGFKYSLDIASQADVEDEVKGKESVKIKKNDYGYEFGFGIDFYLEYFKFSTEVKMYNGLTNVLVQDNTAFSSPIDKLYSRVFLISFNFE